MTFDIKKFQSTLTRLDELKVENSEYKATLSKYERGLEEFKEGAGLYEAFKLVIEDTRAHILEGDIERESLQKYVREHQARVGQDIIDYLRILRDYANDYLNGSNKAFSLLTKTISEIKHCTAEIDALLPLIEHIHVEKSSVEPTTSASTVAPTVCPIAEQILPAEYEFSAYVLSNKQGYSLKSFFEKKKPYIRKVLEHYNHDYQATLSYLQTKHGLCSGQTIVLKTFEALCIDTFGFKKKAYLA